MDGQTQLCLLFYGKFTKILHKYVKIIRIMEGAEYAGFI